MKIKTLGQTSLELSQIGLGTWALGGENWDYSWGKQDDKLSIQTILKAFELGINWVDTAPVYGHGHSEKLLGKALSLWKEEVIIATKCGLLRDSNGHIYSSLKKKSIFHEAEKSLKRLKVDVIDLYQIHWPKPLDQIEEAFSALIELKRQGKIRYAGVSNFSVKQMEKIKKHGPISSLQSPYNLINRRIEEKIINHCKNKSIGIITYSPFQNGLLTGKVTKEWVDNLPLNDWRKTKSSHFKNPELKYNLLFIEELKKFAKKRNRTMPELAISWILSNDDIEGVIVGARNPSQIEQTVSAHTWILDKEEKSLVEKLYLNYVKTIKNEKK